jgi:hypothetical protein
MPVSFSTVLEHHTDGMAMLAALDRLERVRGEVAALEHAGIDMRALTAELNREFDAINKLYHHFFPSGPPQP